MSIRGRITEGRNNGGGAATRIPRLSMFDRFSYSAHELSTGVATEKPFYCYDGESIVIKGTSDHDVVASALEKEGLFPIRGPGGRAMAAVWINRLDDSVIGPYNEIVISIDAARTDGVRPALRESSPFCLLYSFMGGECVSFLHTLYITSPLSIMWGREMQAFPKHPEPADIEIDFSGSPRRFGCRWGERLILEGAVEPGWGVGAFLRESLSLVANFGIGNVVGFLASRAVRFDVVMPRSTKAAYGVENDHTGHLLKGLSPVAVRAWPWAERDMLTLGTGLEADAAEGQESPTDLLHAAGFTPRVVMHIPSLQLVVTDNR